MMRSRCALLEFAHPNITGVNYVDLNQWEIIITFSILNAYHIHLFSTKLELCLKIWQSKPASGEGSTASNAPPAKVR
jgi:hypothetical protein